MTKYKYIEVTPIATAIGAEISGVDISMDVPEPVISEIRQALLEYLVIFFAIRTFPTPNAIVRFPNGLVTYLCIQTLIWDKRIPRWSL